VQRTGTPPRELHFPGLQRESFQAEAIFGIDIETSFRSWMEDMLGEDGARRLLRRTMAERPVPQSRWAFDGSPDLTIRERECLSLLACGYSRREVGDELGIGLETVRQHLGRSYLRLRAANGIQAVVLAALIGELDTAIVERHLFRGWDSPGLAAPGRPVAA
jgi:DNA-binding CsgD family transcriptional regulator